MVKFCVVLFVIIGYSFITRAMKTITSEVGSHINIIWTIPDKLENVIYIAHNNKTMIVVWAKENSFNPGSEYTNRVDFSFLKTDRELILNIRLKNISELDAGVYKCYVQLHDEEMETVKLIVTGSLKESTVKDISWQHYQSTAKQSGPYSITFRPNETIIYEFDALNITCFADCYLSCWFQWIKHGKHDIPELLVSDSATMQILNATRDKAGNYSCIATDTITNKTLSENITLDIIYGPNYVNFNVARMKNSTLVNCSADCYPLCEYSLTVPGQEIIYSKETLHTVTENGTYTCIAINPATGKSSETRILTISYELADYNDSSDAKVLDEESIQLDKLSTPLLTNILLGTALIFTCFIGGLIMYKSRKGCNCGHCLVMTTARECVCCCEVENVTSVRNEYQGIQCITHHPGFSPVCLDIHVLKVVYYQYRQQFGERPEQGNELCKPNSIISSSAYFGPPGIDHGISIDFEMVHTNIDQINKYWTIGQDNTGRLHTVIDDSGASGDPCVGLSCSTIMQNMTPENLDEIRPQTDDDTYIHPV